MLRSDLCDSSDPYVAVKRTIDLLATFANKNDKDQKNAAFKNNAHFRSWISKLNSTLIGNTKDLYIVVPGVICWNIVKIILWHQEVYRIIIEANLMVLMIMLQMVNHLNIK